MIKKFSKGIKDWIHKKIIKLIHFFVSIIEDIAGVVGITLVTIGVYKIYIPAGYITLGLCFLALAFLLGKRGVKKC